MKLFIDHLEKDPNFQKPKETSLHLCYHDEEKRNCLLIFPGGGYEHLAIKKEGTTISKWGQTQEWHTAILTYQLDPFIPSHVVEEVADVMAQLRTDPKIDKIVAVGFSAGGHLAGLIGMIGEKKPDGLLLAYPVTFVNGSFAHEGSARQFYGDPLMKKDYSLNQLVTSKTPPCFIWHTVTDQAVPVENSLSLATALSNHNISYELHLFPTGPHGLGMDDPTHPSYQWVHLAETWLRQF